MKKVGINELYKMILEEMGVDEARSKNQKKRSNKNRIAKRKAREKLQQDIKTATTTLKQFIKTKKKNGLDNATIKKAILLTLKQKGGIQESTAPEDSEDEQANAAAEELLDQLKNIPPEAVAKAASEVVGGGAPAGESSTEDDSEKIKNLFNDFNDELKQIIVNIDPEKAAGRWIGLLKGTQEAANIKSGYVDTTEKPRDIIAKTVQENVPEEQRQNVSNLIMKFVLKINEKSIEEINTLFDELITANQDDATPAEEEAEEQVQLPTESEEKFLNFLKEKVGSSNLIDQRKDKEITLKRFISLAENIVEKLEVDEKAFEKAAITAFRNDSIGAIRALTPGVATLQNMLSKVVEIAKDYGFEGTDLEKIEQTGKELIKIPTTGDIANSELWIIFFNKNLFPEEKIEELKQKFIDLKNTKDAADRLDIPKINERVTSLIDEIASEYALQMLKEYSEDTTNTTSYDAEDFKVAVNALSTIVKKFFIGIGRESSSPFNSAIMESPDEQSFWNLNKKEGDPPDDFFIKFDEQLNNIARLKVWEETELNKLGSSIEELGLHIGDESSLGDDSQKNNLINTINDSAKTISTAAKKSKFYKGLEIIDNQMDKSIEGRGLTGFTKRKAEETYAELKERFMNRFNEKYGTNFNNDSAEGEDSETNSEEPVEVPEDASSQVETAAADLNRYSKKQYEKWKEENDQGIKQSAYELKLSLGQLLRELLESVGVPTEILESNDVKNFSKEGKPSVEKLTDLGVEEYLCLRILKGLINSDLYEKIENNDNLNFNQIKNDIKESNGFPEIVNALESIEMIDIETELSEVIGAIGKTIRKALYRVQKGIGMEPGHLKNFFIHKYIEEDLLPDILQMQDSDGKSLVPGNYSLPQEKEDIPPYPSISIKDALEILGNAFLEIDKKQRETNEEITAATIGAGAVGIGVVYKAARWAFAGRKFSLVRFFEVLTSGGKGVAKKYKQALDALEINNKQKANIAWYFSKKGNVEKFVDKYLKGHSEYDELKNLDRSRFKSGIGAPLSKGWNKIVKAFSSEEEDEQDTAENGEAEDVDSTRSENSSGETITAELEEALKPIIESVIKELKYETN